MTVSDADLDAAVGFLNGGSWEPGTSPVHTPIDWADERLARAAGIGRTDILEHDRRVEKSLKRGCKGPLFTSGVSTTNSALLPCRRVPVGAVKLMSSILLGCFVVKDEGSCGRSSAIRFNRDQYRIAWVYLKG